MPNRDQLEVIKASGEIAFYDLDPGQGVINIGRDLENDIVIESPGVAPFHAVLIHGQKPYHLMALSQVALTILGGEPLPPNVSREVHPWDTIEIDGHTLILLEGEAAAARPARVSPPAPAAVVRPAPAGAASLPTRAPAIKAPPTPVPIVPGRPVGRFAVRPPDQPDDMIVTELSEREWTIDVDQTATLQVTVANGGPLVADFEVSVEGLDPDWVIILPAQINLNEAGAEGSRGTVSVAITPPRQPSSRAGAHHFSVVVTSPTYAGRHAQRGATLTVNPYYEFVVGDLSPKEQTLSYFTETGEAFLPIENRSNSVQMFRLEGIDDERACSFEFQVPGEEASQATQANLQLSVEESAAIPVRVTLRRRHLVGVRPHSYPFTIVSTLLETAQTPRMVRGQLKSRPLMGPWLITLISLCLAALVIVIFWPRIYLFTAEPGMLDAGQASTLHWNASPFAELSIDNDVGLVKGPIGSKEVKPNVSTTYKLTGDNILARLLPEFFTRTAEYRIEVTPIAPEILVFDASSKDLVSGEESILSWEVIHADTLILETAGAPETIISGRHTDQRPVSPDVTTNYVLKARNEFVDQEISRNVTINVSTPTPTPTLTPTPVPPPVVSRFDVQPLEITAGESVQITWAVLEANTVSITPINDKFPPNGQIPDSPEKTTTYVLTAKNGNIEVSDSRTVKVNPAPKTPVIDSFTINPDEIVRGEDAQLAWAVSGQTTNIQISSTDLGTLSGLPQSGTQTVSPNEAVIYILTAFNGDLSASKTASIKVKDPPPDKPNIIWFRAVASGNDGTITQYGDEYYTEQGTEVILSWEVENKPDEVTVNCDGSSNSVSSAPQAQYPLGPVNENQTCTLTAKNVSGSDVATLHIRTSTPIPPPPENFGLDSSNTLFHWNYPADDFGKIDGFYIYRIKGGSVQPDEVHIPKDRGSRVGRSYSYTQALPTDGCGIYFIVAYYYDPLDKESKETDAAATSVGVPCS